MAEVQERTLAPVISDRQEKGPQFGPREVVFRGVENSKKINAFGGDRRTQPWTRWRVTTSETEDSFGSPAQTNPKSLHFADARGRTAETRTDFSRVGAGNARDG
jgi:hypothetical protein